jgi:hypothetical protein
MSPVGPVAPAPVAPVSPVAPVAPAIPCAPVGPVGPTKEDLGTALIPVAPYQIDELSDVVDIASSYDHSLFVKKDGTVWGWGYFVEKWEVFGATPQKAWKDLSNRRA